MIINPRGPGGSGKTELVRRLLGDYGWPETAEPIAGRGKPFGYRLQHPAAGRPLVVLGHYERRSGGCDTISARDGGLAAIIAAAEHWADGGCDVLLEGSALSRDREMTRRLAARHCLHVLMLTTPPDLAAMNLARRQRAGRRRLPRLRETVHDQLAATRQACQGLRSAARVEELDLDRAYARARSLLGLSAARPGGRHDGDCIGSVG